MYGKEESVWLFASSLFESASSSPIFTENRGVSAFVEEFSEKMNVRPELKEAVLSQAREILAFARPLRAHRQLLEIEGQEEFLGTGAATSSLG